VGGARARAAVLRRPRALHARARVLERLGLRLAGADLSRDAAWRRRAPLLGSRRVGSRVPLQQLSEPLSLAAHRPHGRLVRLRRERPSVARSRRAADRLAGQAWAWRRAGVAGISSRRAGRDSRLLRGRRVEHLSALPALPARARRARRRDLQERARRRRGKARAVRPAALAAVSRSLADLAA